VVGVRLICARVAPGGPAASPGVVVVGERLICARVAPGGPAASGGWASGPPGAVGAGG